MKTPLIVACRDGTVDSVKTLLECGANPNMSIGDKDAFHEIINCLKKIELELDDDRERYIHCYDYHFMMQDFAKMYGFTQEELDSRKKKIRQGTFFEKLSLILDYDFDPNQDYIIDKYCRDYPLKIAAEVGLDLVELLLKKGADPNVKHGRSSDGYILEYAIKQNNISLIELLFKYNAKVFPEEKWYGRVWICFYKEDFNEDIYMRLFNQVKTHESRRIIDFLDSRIAKINTDLMKKIIIDNPELVTATDYFGETLLQQAVLKDYYLHNDDLTIYKHEKLCSKLRKNNEKENCDCDYDSHIDLIEFLLDHGSDLFQKNKDKMSVFDAICSNERGDLLKLVGKRIIPEFCVDEIDDYEIFHEYFKEFARTSRLDLVKEMLFNCKRGSYGYMDIYDSASPEIKEFLTKWSATIDDMFGENSFTIRERESD